MSHDFVRGQSVAETCFSHWGSAAWTGWYDGVTTFKVIPILASILSGSRRQVSHSVDLSDRDHCTSTVHGLGDSDVLAVAYFPVRVCVALRFYYSVKRSDVTRWKQVYIRPLPHTSFCETQWRHSVKTRLYKTPPPYYIVLASSVKTKEVKVIEFHRIFRILLPKGKQQ